MNAPLVEIVHREEFSAAHRLHNPALSDEENRRIYGACNNEHGHGHNYVLDVVVRGPVDPRTGMVMNLVDLAGLVHEEIFAPCDHKHLNHDVDFLEGRITTAENLAVAFWDRLAARIEEYGACRLHRIRLYESRKDYVDYRGAAELSTQDLIQELLKRLGEDPTREGLARTPERVSRSLEELTSGMSQSISEVIGQGVFEEDCSEMVIVKDIEFYSLCEHHMLPFYGRVHVAYIPNGKIIGLSKIPRIVDVFARRLQVQERMTVQIAQAIQEVLQPEGVGVVADAAHLCMMMRGVAKQNSSTMTSCLLGRFRSDARTRSEFLGLVRNMH